MDPWKGGVRAYAASLDRLLRQSDAALAQYADLDLVVWSETAFVPAIDWHTRYRPSGESYQLVRTLREYLARQTVPFLIGNDDGQLARNAAGEEVRVDYNAAILFDRGRIVDTYRKLHLVPFTEHFPFERQLPGMAAWLRAADTHFWQQGDRWTVFEAGGVKFAAPICFEDTFGYLTRGFFRRGAVALVNITNDAWSFSVPGAMQHMTMAVFRAAEARRSVVRATNAGITCLIDPNGTGARPTAGRSPRACWSARCRCTRKGRRSTSAGGTGSRSWRRRCSSRPRRTPSCAGGAAARTSPRDAREVDSLREPGQNARMRSRGKILIVDDEPINLEFFDVMLSKLGFTVEKAARR